MAIGIDRFIQSTPGWIGLGWVGCLVPCLGGWWIGGFLKGTLQLPSDPDVQLAYTFTDRFFLWQPKQMMQTNHLSHPLSLRFAACALNVGIKLLILCLLYALAYVTLHRFLSYHTPLLAGCHFPYSAQLFCPKPCYLVLSVVIKV